jgi:hypothetical protein
VLHNIYCANQLWHLNKPKSFLPGRLGHGAQRPSRLQQVSARNQSLPLFDAKLELWMHGNWHALQHGHLAIWVCMQCRPPTDGCHFKVPFTIFTARECNGKETMHALVHDWVSRGRWVHGWAGGEAACRCRRRWDSESSPSHMSCI